MDMTIDESKFSELERYKGVKSDVLLRLLYNFNLEYLRMPSNAEMVALIHELIACGHQVCFITARKDYIELEGSSEKLSHPACYLTVKSLQSVGLDLPVYFTSDKHSLCKYLGVSVHVDDSPEQIKEFRKHWDIPILTPLYKHTEKTLSKFLPSENAYRSVDALAKRLKAISLLGGLSTG